MAKQRLEEIRKIRFEKVKKIKSLGLNPYPSEAPKKLDKISDAKTIGKKVVVAGRIWSVREHGNCCFADIKDETGKIQLFFAKEKIGRKI